MGLLQTLASFISSQRGTTRKTLVITDLTYMWGSEVCMAGLDEQGNCVRPVTPGGVRRYQLFQGGRLAVYPRARVQFDMSPAQIGRPHIEDEQFKPGAIDLQGRCTDKEWETMLKESCFGSVAELFDGHLEEDRRVPPGAAASARLSRDIRRVGERGVGLL